MTSQNNDPDDEVISDEEIARRMESGIRRALNTPPKPTRELIGKTERAQTKRKSRVRKASRVKSKSG